MKFIRLTHLVVLALALTVAGSGCRKGPQNVTKLPKGYTGAVPNDPGGGAANPNKPGEEGVDGRNLTGTGDPFADPESHAGWPEDKEIFKPYTVHFAYDSSAVTTADAANVRSVADHLKANATQAVRVEGHCDERGTEEYNRALGERRAVAVRNELIKLGIAPTRVDIISYGKDKPADPSSGEDAYRKNRRGEFILLKPPGSAA